MASFDPGLCLISCPCAMKLKKMILGPTLHLRFYYVLAALGQYLMLVQLGVRSDFHFGISLFTVPLEGMLALCSPTHSLTRRIGWKIGLVIGFLFLLLSPLFLKIGNLKLE